MMGALLCLSRRRREQGEDATGINLEVYIAMGVMPMITRGTAMTQETSRSVNIGYPKHGILRIAQEID